MPRLALALLALGALAPALAACDGSTPTDAGAEASTDAMSMPDHHDGGVVLMDSGPVLLRPCTMDSQCGDRVDCTRDSCGEDHYCRNTIDLTVCDDGIFCNGIEQCDTVRGC